MHAIQFDGDFIDQERERIRQATIAFPLRAESPEARVDSATVRRFEKVGIDSSTIVAGLKALVIVGLILFAASSLAVRVAQHLS